MKKCFYLFLLVLLGGISQTSAQKPQIELRFSGLDQNNHLVLDSIRIRNLSQDHDTMLYAPDTLLVLNSLSGIYDDYASENPTPILGAAYPNPCSGLAHLPLNLTEAGTLVLRITDITGREVLRWSQYLAAGPHSLEFFPGKNMLYLIHAQFGDRSQTIKVLNTLNSINECQVRLCGDQELPGPCQNKLAVNAFPYVLGDTLLFIAYISLGESGIQDIPTGNKDYFFQFATNTPCPGLDSLLYSGQWYHTIQVFGQCWMKENLNVGDRISSSVGQTNNGIIEKYCMLDEPANCDTLGGLYYWDELMNYTTVEGTQGICPEGWHIPTDADWKILEGSVDANYGIGDPEWDEMGENGDDVGFRLKSTYGWYSGGNGSDAYGFNARPEGFLYYNGNWAGGTMLSTFYTSSQYNMISGQKRPVHRNLSWVWIQISRGYDQKTNARPVRCLKDND